MAPACVLLDCNVTFCDRPQEPDPLKGREGAVRGTTATRSEPEHLSLEAMDASVAQFLRAMKPDLQVVEPPGISRLTMVRPPPSDTVPKFGRHVSSGVIAAVDNDLVVVYADDYTPASSFHGCYLLFDAATSSLSTIPGIHFMSSFRIAGRGTVIMAREGGSFILSELLFGVGGMSPAAQLGMLSLWQSTRSSEKGKWVSKVGHLPDQVSRTRRWVIHISFPVESRNLFCWVDLLHGLLLWDLGHVDSSDLNMSFVPLPHGCSPRDDEDPRWWNTEDFRTMACVDDTIKFLTMDGFVDGNPISFVTYTLDLDGSSPTWNQTVVLRLNDLWADETYISMDLPQIRPLFPILSTQEHDVVYLVLPGGVEKIEGFRVWKMHSMLSVNMLKGKVISVNHENLPHSVHSGRCLLAFTASQ